MWLNYFLSVSQATVPSWGPKRFKALFELGDKCSVNGDWLEQRWSPCISLQLINVFARTLVAGLCLRAHVSIPRMVRKPSGCPGTQCPFWCQLAENRISRAGFNNFKCQLYKAKLSNAMKSPTATWNTKISHFFFFFPQITRVRTSAAETLEVIQRNFLSGKSFWSPYLCDGIICTEIRVQIWIKPLSEICGFLAVKGEHNRILAHMPCTSARSSAGCQHQSVHHSPPTPFHNREHTKKK